MLDCMIHFGQPTIFLSPTNSAFWQTQSKAKIFIWKNDKKFLFLSFPVFQPVIFYIYKTQINSVSLWSFLISLSTPTLRNRLLARKTAMCILISYRPDTSLRSAPITADRSKTLNRRNVSQMIWESASRSHPPRVNWTAKALNGQAGQAKDY